MERLLEAEKIEEESKMLNKALIQMQKEEEQKQLAKKELQTQMREAFKKANIESENFKLLKQEEQRIADMRVYIFRYETMANIILQSQHCLDPMSFVNNDNL